MDSVVGVDLSGLTSGARGRTVAAQLALEPPLRLSDTLIVPRRLVGDLILIDWITARKPTVVAIDAPLSLPHSIACTDAGCERCTPGKAEYLARDVDALAGGMPTAMLAAIAFRGIYLARMLRETGHEVIEAYPAASYRAMGAVGKTYAERAEILGRRVEGFHSEDPDEIDAVCSALVAVAWAMGARDSVIDGRDGRIWLASTADQL